MSATPRTDAAQFGTGRVSIGFARQLERELAAAKKDGAAIDAERSEARSLRAAWVDCDNRRQHLESELADAKKDTARLDWLDKHPVNPQRVYDIYNGWSYRAAIDTAMGETK